MLYGVFSDVHSNLEALNVVLELFSDFEVGGYICCGDLVGYGPDPEACLERLRGLKNLSIVCGNHDLAVLGRLDVDWFNPYARAAALWTRDQLSIDSRRFLESMTAKLERQEFTIAHGTPRKPPEEYLLSAAQFRDNIPYVQTWPLFIGHSHMPLCFKLSETQTGGVDVQILEDQQVVAVPRNAPTALNPGSVGQPRDQDRRAACGLYDSDRGSFRIVRLEYDFQAAQAKIRAVGLPEYLALRLAYGQ